MDLLPFDEPNLADAFSNSFTPSSVISSKKHFYFLKSYLGSSGLNAQTILIEYDYINKDYLEDYTSYYALCFESYPKTCKRVHFFNQAISEKDLKTLLAGDRHSLQAFQDSYLGFVVVKPIPITVLGFTVLKTYPPTNSNERSFWGIRSYTVHLLGFSLEVKSLAFQEQDSVLAACATSAIWFMLNKAALDLHTVLKSPSQITRDAGEMSPNGSRMFPNMGLDIFQICQAITRSGLVTEVKDPDICPPEIQADAISTLYLKKLLNAYSSIGIPIILGINVPIGSERGLHAITVSGFRKSPLQATPPQPAISWIASSIEKIYVHDDQFGPFGRVNFGPSDGLLDTEWTKVSVGSQPTWVVNVIVSLYPKIRIAYENMESIVLGLDVIFARIFEGKIPSDLAWDIKLEFSETYKGSIRESSIAPHHKYSLLTRPLPKYVWIVSCYIGTNRVFDFAFDATGVINAMIGLAVVNYLPDSLIAFVTTELDKHKTTFSRFILHDLASKYLDFILEGFNPYMVPLSK